MAEINTDTPNTKHSRVHKLCAWTICVVLAVALMAAMLWVGSLLSKGEVRNPQRRDQSPPTTAKTDLGAYDSDRPEEMPDRLIGAQGMSALDGDPGGFAPPSGAVRKHSFARRTRDSVETFATYEYLGAVETASEHYRQLFNGRGFVSASSSQRLLIFRKGQIHATVSLRNSAKNENIVTIRFTVTDRLQTFVP